MNVIGVIERDPPTAQDELKFDGKYSSHDPMRGCVDLTRDALWVEKGDIHIHLPCSEGFEIALVVRKRGDGDEGDVCVNTQKIVYTFALHPSPSSCLTTKPVI